MSNVVKAILIGLRSIIWRFRPRQALIKQALIMPGANQNAKTTSDILYPYFTDQSTSSTVDCWTRDIFREMLSSSHMKVHKLGSRQYH